MAAIREQEGDSFEPLLQALKQLEFWFAHGRFVPLLLAAPTLEEFKEQQLPAHCEVTRRKIQGPRIPVQGKTQVNQFPTVLARWPNDGLIEGIPSTLVFVLNGKADILISDYRVHCRVGDILFIPARIPKLDGSRPHYENVRPESHCDLLMVHQSSLRPQSLSMGICYSRADKHEHPGKGGACWVRNNLIAQVFSGIGSELQNAGVRKSTSQLLLSLILLIQEELEDGRAFRSWEFPSESPLIKNWTPIEQAKEYIKNHLDRPLTIDMVARWIGFSRTVFTQRFREETGQSFKNYLTDLRLKEAEELLRNSNLSIERVSKRISLTTGQLRNLFHQRHQCTPREFRERNKNVHS